MFGLAFDTPFYVFVKHIKSVSNIRNLFLDKQMVIFTSWTGFNLIHILDGDYRSFCHHITWMKMPINMVTIKPVSASM